MLLLVVLFFFFFFFKQKTAYEMRISDWSSDVCSSDLIVLGLRVIDALGEGASLRTVGEAFVRADDWPGEGESTKSTARRLVDLARRMSAGGPAKILSGQRL